MSRNSQKPTVTVNSFPGLNTVDDAVEVGHTGLVRALNVDITRKKKVKRRKGATNLLSTPPQAAWADDNAMLLVLFNALLVTVHEDFTYTIVTSIQDTGKLAGITVADRIFYSNGAHTGVVRGTASAELGIAIPPLPAAVEIPVPVGQMPQGKYQIAYTYVRSDGHESGASDVVFLDIDQDLSGFIVSHVASSNTEVVGINIYCSRPNGTELYLATSVSNTTGDTTYSAHVNYLRRHLRTQFKEPPPPFDVVAMGRNNRMMYATGNRIHMSDPYAPEHVDMENTYVFSAAITIIAPIEGGVFICTDELTYYVKGNTLATAELKIVAPYGAVLGSDAHIDGALLGDGEVSDILPVWMSHKGLCVGMPNGSVVNLTQASVVIPKGLKGTSMFRQEDGQNHIVSVIHK